MNFAPYVRQTVDESAKAKLSSRQAARMFALAGDSTFTLVSLVSGVRYTFRVTQKDDERFWFAKTLYGSDNTSDFRYIGWVAETRFKGLNFGEGKQVPISAPVKAFSWLIRKAFFDDRLFAQIEFWHEGRCGRCGRKLTVPSSIESGYGPECINHV